MVSALVLAGLVGVQVGRMFSATWSDGSDKPFDPAALLGALTPEARGDVVTRVGEYSLLTFNAGNDDVLAVVDSRGEQIFFYRVKNQNQFEFIRRESLAEMFVLGQRMGPGGRR